MYGLCTGYVCRRASHSKWRRPTTVAATVRSGSGAGWRGYRVRRTASSVKLLSSAPGVVKRMKHFNTQIDYLGRQYVWGRQSCKSTGMYPIVCTFVRSIFIYRYPYLRVLCTPYRECDRASEVPQPLIYRPTGPQVRFASPQSLLCTCYMLIAPCCVHTCITRYHISTEHIPCKQRTWIILPTTLRIGALLTSSSP
jgi:hypothetical protein